MRVSSRWLSLFALLVLLPAAVLAANPHHSRDDGVRSDPVPGDDCDHMLTLARGETVRFDLCPASNDFDPGAHSCSPCALPGPDLVFELDTQPGERLKISTSVLSGSPDVRLYLATDCHDPAGTCLAATSEVQRTFQHTLVAGGVLYLFVDTTEGCGTVEMVMADIANTARTTWGALKAIYK